LIEIQEVFYNTKGTIVNKENTLVSKAEILSKSKEVSILTAVTITNATYVIKSNHVDYYTNSGHSFFGPSTITSKTNYIYGERFYDTKKILHIFWKSYIKYDDRLIKETAYIMIEIKNLHRLLAM
jgi:predicted amidohydrolase